jgi:hypothetical protein
LFTKGLSVIPLKPKDKRPDIDTWKLFQTHKPTDDNLKIWFGNGSANNIGIVTGEISDIAVVDFDSPEAIEFSKKNNFPRIKRRWIERRGQEKEKGGEKINWNFISQRQNMVDQIL